MKKEELFRKFGRRFYHPYVTQIADVMDFFEIIPGENRLKRIRVSIMNDAVNLPEITEESVDFSVIYDFLEDSMIPLNSRKKESIQGRRLLRTAEKYLAENEEFHGSNFEKFTLGDPMMANQFRKIFEFKF